MAISSNLSYCRICQIVLALYFQFFFCANVRLLQYCGLSIIPAVVRVMLCLVRPPTRYVPYPYPLNMVRICKLVYSNRLNFFLQKVLIIKRSCRHQNWLRTHSWCRMLRPSAFLMVDSIKTKRNDCRLTVCNKEWKVKEGVLFDKQSNIINLLRI
ncbi:hypothetical protein EDC94DRAFT_593794, partial [Helicostylum pulchrum]